MLTKKKKEDSNTFTLIKSLNSNKKPSRSKFNTGKWTEEEHSLFLRACNEYGNDWSKIQKVVSTRSKAQLRSHFQKYIFKLCKKYAIKLKSKKFKDTCSNHLKLLNQNSTKVASCIDEQEKSLLERFNYYQREYQPFIIVKDRNSDRSPCNKNKINDLNTLCQKETQIFKVDKIKSNENQTDIDESLKALLCIYNDNNSVIDMLLNTNMKLDINLIAMANFLGRSKEIFMTIDKECINVLWSLLNRIFSLIDESSLYSLNSFIQIFNNNFIA